MKAYQKSILATSILISLPSILLIMAGFAKLSILQLVFGGGMLVLWWGMFCYLLKGTNVGFWFSLGLVNVLWWPLLWRTGSRIMFIIENGGMELRDGSGSPLAFLLGFVGELIFFIPLCFAMYFGFLNVKSYSS